jgi:2'-5' RNA ligase
MALAVVAFPALAESDGRLIEDLRRAGDPDAARIAAHLTFVFPTAALAADVLTMRVNAVAAKTAPIAFGLRRVMVHHEPPEAYVYLVPDRGYETLVGLHAQLNDRSDASTGRKFVPHVTVARLATREKARSLATALPTRRLAIDGSIRSLSVVEASEAEPVRTIHTAPLTG